MLRVVIPSVPAGTVADVLPVGVDALPVRVPDEIIVVVYGDVVVAAPAASPAPSATTPRGSHSQTNAKRYGHAGGVISRWRIVDWRIRIDGRAVDDRGIVGWDVDHFGTGGLDYDDRFVLHNFRLNFLLLGRFKIACLFRLGTHALHGVHDVRLLGQKRVSQIRGPLDIVRESFSDIRKAG